MKVLYLSQYFDYRMFFRTLTIVCEVIESNFFYMKHTSILYLFYSSPRGTTRSFYYMFENKSLFVVVPFSRKL